MSDYMDEFVANNSSGFIAGYGLDVFKLIKRSLLAEDQMFLLTLRGIKAGLFTVDEAITAIELGIATIELDILEQTSGDIDVLDVKF